MLPKFVETKHVALLLLLATVYAVSFVFVITYPLNIARYDAPSYLAMMEAFESNLIHASGYPFLVGGLMRLFVQVPPRGAYPADFLFALLVVQHLINLAALTVCAAICRQCFGVLAAAALIVFWGLSSTFLSAVSISQPEWLQADLLAVAMFLCCGAFFSPRLPVKVTLYVLAAVTFTCAYLVKFNSAPLAAVLVLLLVLESMPRLWRLAVAAGSGLIAAAIVAAYIAFFHFPSTGAISLTYDHSWLLLTRLAAFGNNALDRSTGINTLRWKALSASIPPDYDKASAYRSIRDLAPLATAEPYRVKYAAIMAMSEPQLRAFVADNPLPAKFNLGLSTVPLYYYVGLPEADALGVRVFGEFVSANPGLFLSDTVSRFLTQSPASGAGLWVPTYADPFDLTFGKVRSNGFRELDGTLPWNARHYWSPEPLLWGPGLRLFGWLRSFAISKGVETALYCALLLWLVFGSSDTARKFVFAVAVGFVLYGLVTSVVVGQYRDKEAAGIWPLASFLWAVAAAAIVQGVAQLRHWRALLWPQPTSQIEPLLVDQFGAGRSRMSGLANTTTSVGLGA